MVDFAMCDECFPELKLATFIVHENGMTRYYCEEHGVMRDLKRGIPVNPAEHENKCVDCQAPLEEGHICDDCSERAQR